MKVEFIAALQGSGCVRLDGDGSGYVKLAFDRTQGIQVLKLMACTEQLIKVTAETED